MKTRGNIAAALLALFLAVPALAACSSDGAKTSCSLDSCTVTFDRGVAASTSILGVEVKFVGVDNGQVKLSVAGQEVTAPVSQETDVAGMKVTVQNVTDTEVVVQIAR
ncbi:hypothetical protein AB0M43_18680 [Longispora sp. NPDC051575]|uniref:hypothetical protein n=1 Tax=Longispora sp. NPDC051575 TaxID=3154943 RepID=UPI003413717E